MSRLDLGSILSRSVSKRSALATDQDQSQPELAQDQKLDRVHQPAQMSVANTTAEQVRSPSPELER